MKKGNIIAWVLVVAFFAVFAYFVYWYSVKDSLPQADATVFAQCLASKKLTMYGASWCSHCQREKSHFGKAFQYVPYVECTENEDVCLAKGITGYPTWIDEAGNKYVGEQGIEGLSKISSCPLPGAAATSTQL